MSVTYNDEQVAFLRECERVQRHKMLRVDDYHKILVNLGYNPPSVPINPQVEIDSYKKLRRRRFISHTEHLNVFKSVGYSL